jgi:protein-S-isoprenylcysteine O-methyltransferase Ste14
MGEALPTLAFVGYGGFLLATFGWSTLRSKWTSGGSPWRGPVSRADTLGETACLLGCCSSLAAPVLALAGVVDPVASDRAGLRALVSALGLASGTGIAISAQSHLADDWRAGVEASSSLVTTGPFARVRNPFYLGCFLASAAVVVAVPSTVALCGLILHVTAAEVIVRAVEEPVLARAQGAAFSRYQERTGRFVPRLRPRRRRPVATAP